MIEISTTGSEMRVGDYIEFKSKWKSDEEHPFRGIVIQIMHKDCLCFWFDDGMVQSPVHPYGSNRLAGGWTIVRLNED